ELIHLEWCLAHSKHYVNVGCCCCCYSLTHYDTNLRPSCWFFKSKISSCHTIKSLLL
uniref:Uncharacterized protein n=1 Tax=Peromyscus maniculatus bairdii TaxID=230844 RepID=A0A8C8W725_PERMB